MLDLQSLMEPGFILAPMFETQARQLGDDSRKFFDVKYKGHRDNLVNAVQSWFGAWSEDPLNKRFASDWNLLIKDLLFDDSGNLTYKPHVSAKKILQPILRLTIFCSALGRHPSGHLAHPNRESGIRTDSTYRVY